MEFEFASGSKETMIKMKQHLPTTYSVINDYFKAKTCSKDISEQITIKQIRDFVVEYQYGVLIALKSQSKEHKESEEVYQSLLEAYRFMHCGDKDSISKFNKIYIKNKG